MGNPQDAIDGLHGSGEELSSDIERIAKRVLGLGAPQSQHDSQHLLELAHALARYIQNHVGRVFMIEPIPVKVRIDIVTGSSRSHNPTYSVGLYVGDELLFCGRETDDARGAAKAADEYRMKLGLLSIYEAVIQKRGDQDEYIQVLAVDTKAALAKLVEQLGESALVSGVRIRKLE